MYFTAQQVRSLDQAALARFLDRRVSEASGFIDYKREYSDGQKNPDSANRELLKDVSSFANAEGGHILVGVDEPDKENAGASFLLGIQEGEKTATAIEQRCADCIDPRIPGLVAFPVPLANGNHVIVVHIPPSPVRPHMVKYEPTKTRSFFIRHSETTRLMETSEVRQAVLSAAAGNRGAIEYALEQEARLEEIYIKGRCAFVVHAAPLVPVDVLWNVTEDEWRDTMMGNHRDGKRPHISLAASYTRPSVEGIVAHDRDEPEPELVYEVHRVGYVGAMLLVTPQENRFNHQGPYFWESHANLFLAFADLCDEAIARARSDRPYLLQATIKNAADAALEYSSITDRISKPLGRREVRFPSLRRDSGQAFTESVHPWTQIFINAFGIRYRSPKA